MYVLVYTQKNYQGKLSYSDQKYSTPVSSPVQVQNKISELNFPCT